MLQFQMLESIILKNQINYKSAKMGASIHTTHKHKIHFIMQKQVPYGKAIYVVGNIPELGCWEIKKSLKLSWFKNHFWTAFININIKQLGEAISYKYIIAEWDNPQHGTIQWEAGKTNRLIEAPQGLHNTICENTWNMERITLNLIVPKQSKSQEYRIIGDCKQLGNWKKSFRLIEKNIQKHYKYLKLLDNYKQNEKNYSVFSISFQVFRQRSKIHYYYIKKDSGLEIQRNPGRKYFLESGVSTHPKCLKISHSRGDTQILQICNFKQLNYSKITQNLFLGSYVKTSFDFEVLKKQGVDSILSIQTIEDIQNHDLTLNYLKDQAKKKDIKYFTYSIEDMNHQQFIKKSLGAIELLKTLIRDGKIVYVHCSAGVYRSPQIVVLYLVLIENYQLIDAVKTVKQRHSFAKPNTKTVAHAINFYSLYRQSKCLYTNF